MKNPVLNVDNITITFRTGFFSKKKTILNGGSFALFSGQLVGLVGNNGAGKTSLLKAICNLIPVESGAITVDKKKVGYLPEQYTAPKFLTARQFMWYAGKLCGLRAQQLQKIITDLFNLLNLTAYADTRMGTLSKGTAQRVHIAQAVINNPTLLILDEPLSGLDASSRNILCSFLQSLKKRGTALLCSTHREDLTLFDYVLCIERGKLIKNEQKKGSREKLS